jgi:two-component system sensor histidine kinase PilS (NtrC family)
MARRARSEPKPGGGQGGPGGNRQAADPGRAPARLERRLVVLLGARLGLALVSLAVAFALDASGERLALADRPGPYGTVAFAFLATVCTGLVLHRIRAIARFAALNVGMDLAIVSALVQLSGGTDSVFTFLYVLVAVYGAILFERRGAIACAGAAAAVYGAVLAAGHQGWMEPNPAGFALPVRELVTLWLVHAGAVGLAAGLGGFLAAEQRRTGAALRERTSDLRRLRDLHQRTVESLMSGLLTTDAEGCITSFNPEAERITGFDVREALGRPADEVVPGLGALLEAREEGGGARTRLRIPYRSRRGQELHLGVGAYLLRGSETEAAGHVVIFQDVSAVVEMERELRRSERLAAVGQLSASIAHEIRNPLAAISGSVQVLQRSLPEATAAAPARRLMEIVVREADRLNHLITDFLLYARPGPLRLEPVAVEEVVDAVAAMFESVRPEGVRLEVEVEPGLRAAADPGQLRQVLWNLVLNASQAMPRGGRLSLGARAEADPQGGPPDRRREARAKSAWVEITVSDEGTGIAPEVVDRIFDPFFTTKRGGSGLGLATVHRIVESHGGSIRVESGVGRGTAMRVRLPRAEAAP